MHLNVGIHVLGVLYSHDPLFLVSMILINKYVDFHKKVVACAAPAGVNWIFMDF